MPHVAEELGYRREEDAQPGHTGWHSLTQPLLWQVRVGQPRN